MKIALICDTHFGARSDNLLFDKSFNDFFTYDFFPYLKENQIEHIIHLGDTFDRRKYINYSILHNVHKYYITPLKDFKSWTILGNHDVYYKSTNQVNSIELLLNSFTNVVSQPTEIDFSGTPILLVPWINPENKQIVIEAIERTNAQLLGGHLELAGFEMRKGHIHSDGMETKGIFDKFDLVFSGHYHHKSTKGNVNYLGCPYEMDWSDYNDPKGFHIFDTETRELEFIPSTNKMYHRITYDDQNEKLDLDSIDFSVFSGKVLKIVVKNKNDPFLFDRLITALEKNAVADLQVIEDHLNLSIDNIEDVIDEAEDTLTIFKKSINQMNINVDKKRLNNLAYELYMESISIL